MYPHCRPYIRMCPHHLFSSHGERNKGTQNSHLIGSHDSPASDANTETITMRYENNMTPMTF